MMKFNLTHGLAACAALLLALGASAALAQGAEAGHGAGRLDRLMQMDANHDGALSAAEIAAGRAAQFTRMDANHDGFVTQDEVPQRASAAASTGQGGGQGGGQGMLTRGDANGDAKLSREEFLARPGRFARIDTNHDGALSAAEIAAARAAMGGN